ncbi:28357_t:CDS:2 [Racocetra persica]|uniref:28357_t:CDS:1 n=1 Tax=Racocetra persica TaxID=160502 RepID=A0ACA9MD48_9GLOM|nr:28357_t:CDS:2 [Racocetra persica]
MTLPYVTISQNYKENEASNKSDERRRAQSKECMRKKRKSETAEEREKHLKREQPRSAAFLEILNQILNNSRPSDSSLGVFQKLLLHTIAERDISAQETCHILLGIPFYHSSRRFITLNLNKEAPRWLCSSGNENEASYSANGEIGQTIRSPLQKYWDRPAEFEDLSLFQLYLRYIFWNSQWKQCDHENIVCIWPHPPLQRNGPQWEEYCRVKVLLHIENVHDLLGPPVENLENEVVNEESDDEQENDEYKREIRREWMILLEMGPNTIIESSFDLGLRDIDQNYDWVRDVIQRRHG